MKLIILFCIILSMPRMAASQDSINPYNTGQHANIILQNTDVYYNPFDPPAPTDNRGQLSCLAFELRDPNGPRSENYDPMTHGVELQYWAPHGTPIGQNAMWMRLFTAANKPDGSPSNIIAGDTTGLTHDSVTVDSLEDVDFNATGDIEMEAGFHVMPGASFHAYIEPKWTGTCATAGDSGNGLVFCDEFADSALSKWTIGVGHGGNIINEANCGYDTNVTTRYSDTDAEDGYALKLDLRYDSCNCYDQDIQYLASSDTNYYGQHHSGCDEIISTGPTDTLGTNHTYRFSIGDVATCPFPYKSATYPLQVATQNLPYGRYEVRSKIPHVLHHENTYGNSGGDNGWNLDEAYVDPVHKMSLIRPYLSHYFRYGPYKGIFTRDGFGDTVFHSPGAHFSHYNGPTNILVNRIMYPCYLSGVSGIDTTVSLDANTAREGGLPASIFNDTISFYYQRNSTNTSDIVTWSIDPTGRYFTGPYGVRSPGDSLYFSKSYQPTSITLSLPIPFGNTTFATIWDSVTGKIFLRYDTFPATVLHNQTSGFTYTVYEGPAYPYPTIPMDTNGYVYHTYAMELFPHECEFYVNGVVVVRFPDRMVPTNDLRYDYVGQFPRTPIQFLTTSLGINYNSLGGDDSVETAYFLNNVATAPGCSGGAAHALVDYVKVWDLPTGYSVSPYKQ